MRAGLLQLTSSDNPSENLPVTLAYLRKAAANGAQFILTPEVTNCISRSRSHQSNVLQTEAEDITLTALRAEAGALGVWLNIGSLALKTADKDGRFANRSFLISPDGEIVARYDKIHMFDVDIADSESFRESAGYRHGARAVMAETTFGPVGLTICYDLRF
ncbi:MAG: nitrilase-related carbon-nitrogen hydrolase, partial [Halocynthiibacter sp.]